MVATTDQKARLLDLITGVLELVRDGKRDAGAVCDVLQKIKDQPDLETSLPLLQEIGTATIPATTEPFLVRDRFAYNIEDGAPVKVSFLGYNSQEWFGDKAEEPVAEAELRYAKLTKASSDPPILAELGGKAETTLSQIYWLMEQQPNGEEGVLLANSWANIFYVRDVNGTLRVVYLFWFGGGWYVDAYSVGRPSRWDDSHRVFSSNS